MPISHLNITGVWISSEKADYELAPSRTEPYGSPLSIEVDPKHASDYVTVNIGVETTTHCTALQWLTPAQTSNKSHPYMFSQCQAIHARSLFPCQDTPDVKSTFSFNLRSPLPVLASGLPTGAKDFKPGNNGKPGTLLYTFQQDIPMPSYLFAIASGDLACASVGPRSTVWTGPEELKDCKWEFEKDTEAYIEAAEKIVYPYAWTTYNVLVLPPSFPYGGMENPTLTFLTPTFIAGDRSLVGLVAHELAHSWSGNLVTNAVWADSWLNEGFTSYFENRIMEALYGPGRAAQEAALSHDDMMASFREAGMTSPRTRLHLAATEGTPDGGLGGIVYDKGALFLRTIEQTVGRARWDAYLRSYFDRHAFQPMTSGRFLADFRANLVRGDTALEQRLRLDEWVFQPGLPANAAGPDPAAFASVDAALAAWIAGTQPLDPDAWRRWTAAEQLRFVNRLPRQQAKASLDELNERFQLNDAGNNEVLFAWLSLALANRYEPALPAAERFLTSVGRRKFVVPLYQALWSQGDWGRPAATRLYARARSGYHPVTQAGVDRVVGRPAG